LRLSCHAAHPAQLHAHPDGVGIDFNDTDIPVGPVIKK